MVNWESSLSLAIVDPLAFLTVAEAQMVIHNLFWTYLLQSPILEGAEVGVG